MRLYFLIPDFYNLYEDGLIYLAEGLKELNIQFYSNRNYWRTAPGDNFLFNYHEEINPADCDVIIVSNQWTQHINPISFKHFSNPLPSWLFKAHRKYATVYVDNMDGYYTYSYSEEARQFDVILRCKYLKNAFQYPNMKPWVLGFTSRVAKEKLGISNQDKQFKMAVNFGYSHNYEHQLRRLVRTNFISRFPSSFINDTVSKRQPPIEPFGKLMFEQTTGLHNPEYFQNIERTLINATFCGDLIPSMPFVAKSIAVHGRKAQLRKAFYNLVSRFLNKPPRIVQWDSWRFWETLVLGSVPVHINLEKHGVQLPVMPEHWVHYIGIDLNNIQRDVDRILEDEIAVRTIAKNGNKWVTEYYSPANSAKRLLKMLSCNSI